MEIVYEDRILKCSGMLTVDYYFDNITRKNIPKNVYRIWNVQYRDPNLNIGQNHLFEQLPTHVLGIEYITNFAMNFITFVNIFQKKFDSSNMSNIESDFFSYAFSKDSAYYVTRNNIHIPQTNSIKKFNFQQFNLHCIQMHPSEMDSLENLFLLVDQLQSEVINRWDF